MIKYLKRNWTFSLLKSLIVKMYIISPLLKTTINLFCYFPTEVSHWFYTPSREFLVGEHFSAMESFLQ